MVMRRDSQSKGCGFESRHRILDGQFFTYICYKNLNFLFEKAKIKRKKEAAVDPFF